MSRPAGLADFANPPLDEVVLGVQFVRHPEYNDLFAWRVREAFKAEFPNYSEVPRLDPRFEVFGGADTLASFQFNITQSEPSKRYWFIADDDSHLLQFQDDRFFLNWRRRPGNLYPRHEAVAAMFYRYLERLGSLYISDKVPFVVKQAEIAYINVIPMVEKTLLSDWLSIVNPTALNIEQLNANFSEVVFSRDGENPVARMYYEVGLFTSREVRRAIRLMLTYRGAPVENSSQSIVDFIAAGRERIVNRFCDITTEKAHRSWSRKQ
ncbi:TIGR04255 family protein [Mesorhizobium huakuii]|uniref:TIGR04255 family protein n=1 Tax=Mesorhizobium huakuii TaxID=28104 RepID=A0A7G6T0Y2_9HYPH|nr:TIGR04255 family protein [Mesorhizobium huakuii]QND60414.1 TIGR04255 family protein [Mesorhizobium huakuii]